MYREETRVASLAKDDWLRRKRPLAAVEESERLDLGKLPLEVLESEFIHRLPLPSLLNLGMTSRLWRRLCASVEVTTEEINLAEFAEQVGLSKRDTANPLVLRALLNTLKEEAPRLCHISPGRLHPDVLLLATASIAELFPDLESLSLPCWSRIAEYLPAFRNLSKLVLRDICEESVGYSDEAALDLCGALEYLDNLKSLEMEFLSRRVWDHLPDSLESLHIALCHQEDPNNNSAAIIGSTVLPNLKELHGPRLYFHQNRLDVLTPKLESLGFVSTPHLRPFGVIPMEALPLSVPSTLQSLFVWAPQRHQCGVLPEADLNFNWLRLLLDNKARAAIRNLSIGGGGGEGAALAHVQDMESAARNFSAGLALFPNLRRLRVGLALSLPQFLHSPNLSGLRSLDYAPGPNSPAPLLNAKAKEGEGGGGGQERELLMGQLLEGFPSLESLSLQIPPPSLEEITPQALFSLLRSHFAKTNPGMKCVKVKFPAPLAFNDSEADEGPAILLRLAKEAFPNLDIFHSPSDHALQFILP